MESRENDGLAGLLEYPLDPETLLRKKRILRRELLSRDVKWLDKRIAILCGSTANDIRDFLELFLLNEGIRPSFYLSEYDRFYEDAVFDNPALKAFSPDIIFLHTSSRNITRWPDVTMDAAAAEALLAEQFGRFRTVWDALAERYGCPVVQNNFDRPAQRLLGNRDIWDWRGGSNFVFRLNGLLYAYAAEHKDFYVHDIDYLAGQYGQERWQDPNAWALYKYAMSVKAIPEFARDLAHIIKAIYGKNKKTVVLDLDNTLWGGVVGDDGPENLEIGPETAAGESFTAFQTYLKRLGKMGVLLAVDSKNDEANAVAGLEHPSGVLRPEDFAHLEANWLSKDQNMQTIAQALNLGLDSFVFVDDNPAERSIVRAQVPAVTVAEADEPWGFMSALDHGGYFEVASLTKDDLARGEMYRANAGRQKLERSFENYRDYLLSLQMRAVIRDFEPVHMQRIVQLTNKTNQFNLTTKRYTDAEMRRVADSDGYIRLYGRLEDKFGDNGIVSVTVGRIEGKRLHMELWLMSCRVLKRDMELAMFDQIVEQCRARGLEQIVGYYYPTAKNGMVRELYGELGFEKVSEEPDGAAVWTYSVAGHQTKNTVIEIVR